MAQESFLRTPPPGIPENRRRWVVRLFFVAFLLLVFEGALRKWVWPEAHRIIFFIRDPFVLLIYVLAWTSTIGKKVYQPLRIGGIIAFCSIIIPVFHGDFSFNGLILSLYGWRNYFMLLPLPFIIMEALKKEDLEFFVKMSLVLTFPMALLVYQQSFLPSRDPLNWGINPEIGFESLPVGRGLIRASGTFTSVYGPVMMIGSSLALVLSMWILPSQKRPIGSTMLFSTTFAVITMVGVSGSRLAYVLAATIVIVALASSMLILRRGMSQKAFIFPLIFTVASALLIPAAFPLQFEALAERAIAQTTDETGFLSYMEIFFRPWQDIAGFFNALMGTPLFGYGLGTGGNAGAMMGVLVWAEGEWARHLIDLGPLLGLAFVCFRFMMIWYIGKRCVSATHASNNPLPLFLCFFTSVLLFNGHVTAQGTVNGYAWMFAGLALGAAKIYQNEADQAA